jgi:hypothetical protein
MVVVLLRAFYVRKRRLVQWKGEAESRKQKAESRRQ